MRKSRQDEVAQFDGAEAAAGDQGQPDWEVLGIDEVWNSLQRGLASIRAAATGVVGKPVGDRVRTAVIPGLTNFLGDVFVYLAHADGAARPIRDLIANAIRDSAAERTPDDPLVIVGHSLGGIITYDVLTSSLHDVEVDLYVTAGTQVGLFEELKLFTSSDRNIPGSDPTAKVPAPGNIRRWINVFDYSDLLGFSVARIIEGATDFSYSTGSLLKAHSLYFLQPGFHRRLTHKVHGAAP